MKQHHDRPGSLQRMVRPVAEVRTETIWLANIIIAALALLLTAAACWMNERALDRQSKRSMPQSQSQPQKQ